MSVSCIKNVDKSNRIRDRHTPGQLLIDGARDGISLKTNITFLDRLVAFLVAKNKTEGDLL